jgi:hypothetical protein
MRKGGETFQNSRCEKWVIFKKNQGLKAEAHAPGGASGEVALSVPSANAVNSN